MAAPHSMCVLPTLCEATSLIGTSTSMTMPAGNSPEAAPPRTKSYPTPGQRAGCEPRLLTSPPGAEWDQVARTTGNAHLGMASHWFTAIKNAYGHRPLYFCAQDEDEATRVLLPSFLIRRWPLKGVVTSMPFLDAGGPAGHSAALLEAVLNRLVLEAETYNASRVELRSLVQLDTSIRPSLEKVTLARSLPPDPDLLWRDLDSKVRNQIRKAERSGISIGVGGLDRLDEFYQVFAVNMRDLGSPVHSKRFFHHLLEGFGEAAQVLVARKDSLPVGGLIAVSFGDTRYVPWASTLRTHSALCPNMLLYWEALRRACLDGMARFDFGRSSRDSGTYRFKRQWGAEDIQLYWYTIPLQGARPAHISRESRKWALISQAWSRLPVGLTRVIGPAIRRRLTQ